MILLKKGGTMLCNTACTNTTKTHATTYLASKNQAIIKTGARRHPLSCGGIWPSLISLLFNNRNGCDFSNVIVIKHVNTSLLRRIM